MSGGACLIAACAVVLAVILISAAWRGSSDGFRGGGRGFGGGHGFGRGARWGPHGGGHGVSWGRGGRYARLPRAWGRPRTWGPAWWDSSSCNGCGAACDRADPAYNPSYCAYCAMQCPMSARF